MGNSDSKFSHIDLDEEKAEVFEDWMMTPGCMSGTPVTVFSVSHPLCSKKRPYFEKALQRSKVLRHPGLLRFLDGGICDGEVIVVTEKAKPLLKNQLKQTWKPLHVSLGLSSLVQTLVFLHEKAGISHNNLGPASIFVTPDGSWKLWGLEYSCSFSELTRDYIEHINNYCCEKSKPPDEKSRIFPAYQHARDSYGFGQLVDQILLPDITSELVSASDFLTFVKTNCFAKDWSVRPQMSTLLAHPFFHQDFIELQQNLSNILLMSEVEQMEFFKSLPDKLRLYPEDVVAGSLGIALFSRSVFLTPSAGEYLIPALLTLSSGEDCNGGIFTPTTFSKVLLPYVLHLFRIHDAAVRGLLLTHFQSFVHLIPTEILIEVLPELLLGIRDTNDELVAATLKALAMLVPLLGGNTVIGSNRSCIFTISKPKAGGPFLENSVNVSVSPSYQEASIETEIAGINRSFSAIESSSLDDITFEGLTAALIPERSSPDGGEDDAESTVDDDDNSNIINDGASSWSDWEEPAEMHKKQESSVTGPQIASETIVHADIHKITKSKKQPLASSGLGEEFDIMSINVAKKKDSELELFAELVPKLSAPRYNLEFMLEEANRKMSQRKNSSVSDALSDLVVSGVEGDAWNDEANLNDLLSYNSDS